MLLIHHLLIAATAAVLLMAKARGDHHNVNFATFILFQ